MRQTATSDASGERAADGEEPAAERAATTTESIFLPAGEGRFEPTEHARGPWTRAPCMAARRRR
jgi:hypothetical protein